MKENLSNYLFKQYRKHSLRYARGIGMFIVIGLGNPGRQYDGTRHNIGYDVLDALAKKHNIKIRELKHKGIMGKGSIYGYKAFLVKPLTFMNLSGECVRQFIDYYKINEREDMIVIADDINLPPGQIRIRKKGSAGGHNGLKSIIQHLGHEEFMRIRMGVGDKPTGYDLAGYVLGNFDQEEKKIMDESIQAAVAAIECIIEDGIDKAMNVYNKKNKTAESSEEKNQE